MTDPKDMTRLVERLRAGDTHARFEAAVEKLKAMRRMCAACDQPFYVICLDEALAALQGSVDRLNDERISE